MAIGVLTSGGDAPGMNAVIRAVTKVAASHGYPVWGILNGFDGLIDGRFRPLTREVGRGEAYRPLPDVEYGGGLGGTILGTARSPRFYSREGRAQAAATFRDYSLNGLVVIGGNGSMEGAHQLALEHDVGVVGIPASIDNDIGLTREAIGVDTALNTIVEACDRISDTASSHHRAFIVEVMGRNSGYLAMAAAVATAADAVLLPEQGRTGDEVVKAVVDVLRQSFAVSREKRRVLILKAEGVEIATEELVDRVRAEIGGEPEVEIRATILGHLVRGGNPSFRDRLLAGRFGLVAVNGLLDGRSDVMTGWNIDGGGIPTSDSWISLYPITDVMAETEALLDGSSQVTLDRVRRMEDIQGVLSI
ncbi:MAG TPA: ATP-dependent 6-phosphofructokinase [Acidimicrobiia bacterium]|nr:ATP-dependent 6-phosphofructokinase [Acidimicrobiia bacterium]